MSLQIDPPQETEPILPFYTGANAPQRAGGLKIFGLLIQAWDPSVHGCSVFSLKLDLRLRLILWVPLK